MWQKGTPRRVHQRRVIFARIQDRFKTNPSLSARWVREGEVSCDNPVDQLEEANTCNLHRVQVPEWGYPKKSVEMDAASVLKILKSGSLALTQMAFGKATLGTGLLFNFIMVVGHKVSEWRINHISLIPKECEDLGEISLLQSPSFWVDHFAALWTKRLEEGCNSHPLFPLYNNNSKPNEEWGYFQVGNCGDLLVLR